MKQKLDIERGAYEELKVKIIHVNKRIKHLKKKNIKDAILAKKVERFLNRDFQKWTDCFSRKSVLFEDK
jgi:DUF1009 family protein